MSLNTTRCKANPWLLFLGGVVSCVVVMPVGVGAQEWDLSGHWVIVEAESDAPADIFETLAQRRSSNSGVGVGVGIFGVPVEVGRSGGRGRKPEEVVRRDLRRLPLHLYNDVDALEVEQSQDAMRVRYGDQGAESYPAGETIEQGDGTSIAQWRRDVYTVVRRFTDGLRATEELYLDRSDSNRLRRLVTIELTSRRTVRIRGVFERYGESKE